VKVRLSSHLFEYTGGQDELEATGASARELLRDLDSRHPGLYFRVVDEQGALRPHINVFLGNRAERDLDQPVGDVDRVHVLGALSGG
jgi:sulfur-carrier protein